MISQIETTSGNGTAPIYQLEITLEGPQPAIWRRLQVPGNASLGWLHAVIQVVMGWTNSHLHQFHFGNQTYSDPAFELGEFEGDLKVRDEKKTILMKVAPQTGTTLGYEYDFGDSWQHQITVERIRPSAAAAVTTAHCLDGARACPPEDCGGVSGYVDLLKILKNRKHKEHKSMMAWLGRPFNAEVFDINSVNKCLSQFKWPRVTESQLRKVLMVRDGFNAP